jgi:hemolysin activation/secretion protein
VKELQLEYHNRGFDTISVTIPQQRLTNGVFKIRVFEGRLAEIVVDWQRLLQFQQRHAGVARFEDQHVHEQQIAPASVGFGQRQSGPADLSGNPSRPGLQHHR